MTGIRSIFTLATLAFGFTQIAYASLPVTPAKDQQVLLKSSDPKLAKNKKLVYDFWRIVLSGRQLDQAAKFLSQDYIQHNPNVATGLDGFLAFFKKLGGPRPIPETVPGLVAIQAEGDLVTFSFVNELDSPQGKYTTTWFDMFRVENGKITEHWDCDVKAK